MDKLSHRENPPVNSQSVHPPDQQWSPIAGSPEAILAGLNDSDAQHLDSALFSIASISTLTVAQKEAVADVLFGFVLSRDFGEPIARAS
jgi:2-keto-3-deoxy-galactonokinase